MDPFIILRNITIAFAALMVLKYFIFLLLAPFYGVKIARRNYLITKSQTEGKSQPYSPLISVIVPAWNEQISIAKTMQSVIDNSYDKIELIVINDGSTDDTEKSIRNFIKQLDKKQKKKIKHYNQANGGKGAALNYGTSKATGEIVMTVDADSALHPSAIENLTRYFADSKIDGVVGNVKVANNETLIGLVQQLEYLFGFYSKRAHCMLGAEYIFGGACAAFRKSATFDRFGGFDTENKTEDIEMSMRLKSYGLKSLFAEDVICYTEGASTLNGLLQQRLRWKKGRIDTFLKYRGVFFSRRKEHNTALSWFILPYALLAELQVIFEPIGFTLLIAYSIIAVDYLSLSLGIMFIFTIYFVLAVFNQHKLNLKLIGLFPFTWPMFYILTWIEYVALMYSVRMLLKSEQVSWQSWSRNGIEPLMERKLA